MIKFNRKHMTTILEGGTGNQLFMYFAGLSASIKLDSHLTLDTKFIGKFGTDHGCFLDRISLSAGFEKHTSSRNFNILTNRIINALARRSNLIKSIQKNLFGIYRSNQVGYDPEIFKFKRNMKIYGYFQSWRYFDYCSSVNQANIELVDPSDSYLTLRELINEAPTIAVHVRRGDYGSLSSSFGLLDESYYINGVNHILAEHGMHRIWVFSDEIAEVKSGFNNEIWNDALFTNFNLNPMETIFLMAQASSRVISNSSFSYWSALLSRATSKNVAPGQWFKALESPRDLLPPEWTTLESSWLD